MIGVISAKGRAEPIYPPFARIRKRDDAIYYAIRDCVIVGIFKIVSDMQYLDDPIWGPSCVYKIATDAVPPSNKALDVKNLIRDSKVRFEPFPAKERWQGDLRGHACRPISDRDYGIIRKRVFEGPGLIPFSEIRPP